jgi:hypothetical protein
VSWPAVCADATAGSVKTVQGAAFARRGAERLPMREGMHLVVNDVLETGADGRLGVILQDGTRLALGPNAELRMDQFVYQPVDGKFGLLLRLSRGALAYISGKIAQFSAESVKVETPAGVIGLRGTHFAVSIEGM